MRGLALLVVNKEWAEIVKAQRAFAEGQEETKETVSFVVRVLARESFGLLAEGLTGLGDRESPLRILVPWHVIWAVIDAEIFEKPGRFGIAAFGFVDASAAVPRKTRRRV